MNEGRNARESDWARCSSHRISFHPPTAEQVQGYRKGSFSLPSLPLRPPWSPGASLYLGPHFPGLALNIRGYWHPAVEGPHT